MEIKPVKRYQPPKYATYDYFLTHPELLSKVPARWHGNQIVMGAICALAVMMSSNRSSNAHPASPAMIKEMIRENQQSQIQGNMLVVLPISLTEAEATKIILEQAAKSGINFKVDTLKAENIDVPLHINYIFDGRKDTVLYSRKKAIVLDGYDPDRKIAYEYVTEKDIDIWRNGHYTWFHEEKNEMSARTDIPRFSKDLRRSLQKQDSGNHYGVFYDQDGSEIALREQVNEFIKWLRAEGII